MAKFQNPGAFFLGTLVAQEQKFLKPLIENARKQGYTRFVEPCAGAFAMSHIAAQCGYKPSEIEASDVSMFTSIMGYAITGQSLEELEIRADGFTNEELLDPAVALYAQLYLRTVKNAGKEYFYGIMRDLEYRKEEHLAEIRAQLDRAKQSLHGMSYRPLDMWKHLETCYDDPHCLVVANPPTYAAGFEKWYDTGGRMTWKEPEYGIFDPKTGLNDLYDKMNDAKCLLMCYEENAPGLTAGHPVFARYGVRDGINVYLTTNRPDEATMLAEGKMITRPNEGKAWVAMTGNVDADKVILRENITLAGGYTQVGNLTKSQNGTATFSTKGKSVMDALTEIFSKRLQPSITAQPSIGTFTLTGAGAVEAGTKVAAAAYSGATLNAGSYQYGPATGVTATNWKVERITNAATKQVTTADAASLTAGSDNNGGSGFIIGDAGGDNAVSSLKYRVTATHGAGVTAKDNLGADSSPVVAIAAGSKTKDTAAYTPFRNVFYGAATSKPALDSAAIRALGKTGKAYAAGTLTINVPVGAQRVAIACIATAKGVTKVINETAMNADVTSTFTKSTVSVEGANGYAAKDYNVWVFEPAVAYGNAAVLKVTLG